MASIGGGKINPNPCSPEDEKHNWLVQSTINNTFNEFVTQGGVDANTVLVTADDSTASVLHGAITDVAVASTYVALTDIPVYAETTGAADTDQTERFFIDVSTIAGHSPSGTLALHLVNNVITWATPGSGSDAFTVKCTTDDSTASFLHDAIEDVASAGTYIALTDIPIFTETVGDAETDQTERLFIDVDSLAGHSPTGTHALCIVDDVTTYVDTTTFATTLTHKVKVNGDEVTEEYLHAQFDLSASYDEGLDMLVAAETRNNDTERLFVDVSIIPGWDDEGDFLLLLSNNALSFVDPGTVSIEDTFQVKCTTNDSTESFLHDAFTDAAVRDITADPLVKFETQGGSGTNQTETAFLDSSVITGYPTVGEEKYLALENDQIQWKAPSSPPEFEFGRVASGGLSAATGWAIADAGTGDVELLDDDGNIIGAAVEVLNRYFDTITEDAPVWVAQLNSGDYVLMNAGCTTGP